MEIPDRVKQNLDGESVQSAVSLGDEDIVCFTATRTLLYRGEGLLSDESLEVFSHDIERLKLKEGRRKTAFELEYVDSVESFSVGNKRAQKVLRRLLAGVLDQAGVLDDEESLAGVFLFSELTIVITESRLVKHIGTYVWDPDYEEYSFSEVTGLEFEEGSVATQIVLSVRGRPQRIKAPSDKAAKLRRTLTNALFAYYEVDSLDELNGVITPETDEDDAESEAGGLGLDNSISPLVDDDDDEDPAEASSAETNGDEAEEVVVEAGEKDEQAETDVLSVGPRAGEQSEAEAADAGSASAEATTESTTAGSSESAAAQQIDPAEIEEMREEIAALKTAVEKQGEQIQAQRETIEQLIEELRKHV